MFLGYIGINLIAGLSKVKENYESYPIVIEKSTYKISNTDSALIKVGEWGKIKVKEVFNIKGRNPVAQLTYDDAYNILLYKIDLSHQPNKINDILQVKLESESTSVGEGYLIIGSAFFNFSFHGAPTQLPSKVYFTMSGDSITQNVANDSLIAYHLVCHDISISYTKAVVDLSYEAKSNFEDVRFVPIHMNIAVRKQGKSIYFFCMTPIHPGNKINPNLLINLIR